MWSPLRSILLALSLLGPTYAQAQDCGPDAPCTIATGSYHLRLPEAWNGTDPLPVLVFFHGHRSSGRMIFRSGGLERSFLRRGYAVVAPNGVAIEGTASFAWPARDRGAEARDDVTFVLDVLEDLARRAPLDQERIFAAGFSAGGSMAWQLACYTGDRFAGYAALAGTLRQPQRSATCPAGPVNLLQIHGYRDNQVPLEGRAIRDWHQGDVFAAMDALRGRNGCRSHADTIETEGPFWCRDWSDSCQSGALRFCLHPGGHGLPQGWTDLATDFFETAE